MCRFMFALALAAIGTWGTMADEIAPGIYRTPENRFENLPEYSFAPHYFTHDRYRVHFVDEGPRDGAPVLLLHGEPSWSYLYRTMIPLLAEAGYRVVAPDLIGFGRSDKPANRSDYSYALQVAAVVALIQHLDLTDITLFCQDWGGLVGLRVATEHEARFARIVAANTGLPAGPGEDGTVIGTQFSEPDPNATLDFNTGFMGWLRYSQSVPVFDSGLIVQAGTVRTLPDDVVAAYNAPFPDERYRAGARVLPTLVMSQAATNRKAWEVLERWEKPFLTAFSDSDPITKGGHRAFVERIPGAKGQSHTIIEGGGHFLQEDRPEELARLLIQFIRDTD